MHSGQPYKSFIWSVILGELKSFRNYEGFGIIFPKRFRCNVKFYESEIFSDSSLHHILESENFRFLLSKKKSVTWVVNIKKSNFRKS